MPLPPRRWFQFRLTMWFVLVAILAWAMIQWPWWYMHLDGVIDVELPGKGGTHRTVLESRRPNPALLYPALALAAFVGWKAAWAIGRRVAARKAERA